MLGEFDLSFMCVCIVFDKVMLYFEDKGVMKLFDCIEELIVELDVVWKKYLVLLCDDEEECLVKDVVIKCEVVVGSLCNIIMVLCVGDCVVVDKIMEKGVFKVFCDFNDLSLVLSKK